MKFTLSTIKYVLKNFAYIFLFAVIPATFLALSLDEDSIEKVLTAIFEKDTGSLQFLDLFRAVSLFNFRSGKAVLFALGAFVSTVFCASLLLAFLEKHMRIGKRTLSGVFSHLNDNVVSTFGICLLLILIYELWAMIVAALLSVCVSIDKWQIATALSVVVFLGGGIVLLYVVSEFYVWLPCMQITGFHSFEALRYSNQLVAPVKGRIVSGQWLSMLVSEGLLALCTIKDFPNHYLAIGAGIVLYTLMFLFFCVRMEVVYFDRAQIDRADLRKYYYV